MVKILVIEDDRNKAGNIANLLDQIPGCRFELAPDIVSARKHLQEQFNLMIVDMNLPERYSDHPKESAGMDFILEVKKTRRLKLPEHIIGLTAITTLHEKYKDLLNEKFVSLIKYEATGSGWQTTIQSKVEEVVLQERNAAATKSYEYDVAIITALLTPELEAVLKLGYNWTKIKLANDSTNYWEGKTQTTDGQKLNIVATHSPQMGMVAAANSCAKLIGHFRPQFVIMTGICGGVEGKVNLGDLVICDLSFDLDSGKIIEKNGQQEFEPDYRSIQLDSGLKDNLMEMSTAKTVLRSIQDTWQGDDPPNELKLHLGPVGSGAAVISNSGYISDKIKHQRKLLAIDMETYAIFYTASHCTDPKPKALSIKAISDHANADKGDKVQKYCAHVSACTADYIIKHLLF